MAKNRLQIVALAFFEKKTLTVTFLGGQSAIINHDIQHQLKDATTAFNNL